MLGAWLAYAALATFFVWPALADPAHLALGAPGNDVGNHVWGYAWVASELLGGAAPVHTRLLAWPTGGSLWFVDAFDVALTLPANALWGPVAAYNAGIWFNFWLAGVGAHALAHRLTGSHAGATVAGVLFAATPQLLGQAYNGISETLAVGWLPLALVALDRALEAPTPRRAALAGLAQAVATLANWYYGLFGLLVAPILALPALLRARRDGTLRRQALAAVVYAFVFVVVAGPPFAAFSASMASDDALVTRDPVFVWRTLILHNMTDVVALLHPGRFYSPDLRAVFGEDLIVVVYVGYALLVPAAIGAWYGRPRAAVRPWAVAAGMFLLLALGPFLYVAGDYARLFGGWIPLPFLALFQWFPMFSRISHAYRFVVGVSLALAMLAAFAVRAARQRGWDVAGLASLVVVARIAETTLASSAVFPLPVTEVRPSAALATLDGGAVLDLPVSLPVLSRSRYLLDQLAHREPVPYGLNDPTPEILHANRYTRFLLELERTTVTVLPDTLPLVDLELGRLALVDDGMRWIVVHDAEYPEAMLRRVLAFLDLTATPHLVVDGLHVYRLDDPTSSS